MGNTFAIEAKINNSLPAIGAAFGTGKLKRQLYFFGYIFGVVGAYVAAFGKC
jgi:hypothetical protein